MEEVYKDKSVKRKVCNGCKQRLSVSEFSEYLSGPRKGKFLHQCKLCILETAKAASERWRIAHPESLDGAAVRHRTLRKENPEYFRAIDRKFDAKRRRQIDLLKMERGCYDCGVMSLPPSCYDWDHLPGKEKLFNIGAQQGSFGLDSVIAEIDKCQLVCANCHRIRTENRKKKGES